MRMAYPLKMLRHPIFFPNLFGHLLSIKFPHNFLYLCHFNLFIAPHYHLHMHVYLPYYNPFLITSDPSSLSLSDFGGGRHGGECTYGDGGTVVEHGGRSGNCTTPYRPS
ncbi:hypothetical protein ABFS83_12G145400 [Erythranthe nasuta]